MSWYRTGTVAVTNGSKTVTGVGTLWTTAVNVGDAFALVDANLNPTDAWYEVESVTNNTTLVLKQSYAGSTGSNKQYCVFNLVGNMTTPSFAQRLATFFASFQSLIDKPTTTPTASSIPIADANGDIDSGWIKDATASVKGVVELATAAEATAGADTTRAITPSVSGSRLTFATTSTDDATSATAAPLKSAGGLAVAKGLWLGGMSLNGVDFFRRVSYAAATSHDVSIATTNASTYTAHVYFICTRAHSDYEVCSIQTFIVTVWGTSGINVAELSRVDGSEGSSALTITHPSASVLRFTSSGATLKVIVLTRLV